MRGEEALGQNEVSKRLSSNLFGSSRFQQSNVRSGRPLQICFGPLKIREAGGAAAEEARKRKKTAEEGDDRARVGFDFFSRSPQQEYQRAIP